jgi:hypothetical protein
MPTNSIVFCNRAQAYKKIHKFQLMYDDSLQAIELDDQYFKAYVKNGEACIELGKNMRFQNTDLIDKGLKRLQKALFLIEKLNASSPYFSAKKKLEQQVS